MFSNILYACDPLREDEWGGAAADLASRFGARLTVLREASGERRVAAAVEEARAGRCDLIAAAADASGLPDWLARSAARRLLREAPCPVWTLPRGVRDYRRVLCAVDHTADAVAVVCQAADLALHLEAELTLVHAVPMADDSTMAYMRDAEPPILSVAEARRHLVSLARAAGVDAAVAASLGAPRHVVARALQETGAGALVVGRSHRGRCGLGAYFARRTAVLMKPAVAAEVRAESGVYDLRGAARVRGAM